MIKKPCGFTVLIKVDEEEKEKGGIVLADIAVDRPMTGTVIKLGMGIKDRRGNPVPFDVSVGDKVLVPQFGGNDIEIDGVQHRIVKHQNLLGVVS